MRNKMPSQAISMQGPIQTRPAGLEPATFGFEDRHCESLSEVESSTYESDAKSSAICSATTAQQDPDLRRVVEAWPSLPKHIKQSILALCGTAAQRHADSDMQTSDGE